MPTSTEFLLLRSVLGIYVSFITWGYFQERVTAVDYVSVESGESRRFKNVMVLNFCMGLAAFIVGCICLMLNGDPLIPKIDLKDKSAPKTGFVIAVAEVAFTNTIASPFGYAALAYITYPMLVLAKASKLLPIMLMGMIFGGKRYKLLDFVSGLLITAGIALFSYKKSKAEAETDGNLQLFGLGLVFCNLLLDGYTNAKQEKMYKAYDGYISSYHMMTWLNGWTALLIGIWLGSTYVLYGETSDFGVAITFFQESPDILPHIVTFSLMGSVGQIFIFLTMKEFGAMINTTICLTRKFFSICLSILFYAHPVTPLQWAGVFTVFSGLSLQTYLKMQSKPQTKEKSS